MENELNMTKEAADFLHGHLVGLNSARTENPEYEKSLNSDSDTMMDAYNEAFNAECFKLGKDPILVVEKMDDAIIGRVVSKPAIKRIMVRNAAEIQIWNDAADYFREAVRRGEELIIPLIPGRTLTSMYQSMRNALIRRGISASVKQCSNTRWRLTSTGYVQDKFGRPSIVLIHKGMQRMRNAKQHDFFEYHGGAVVYVKDEPFYGTYVGEEGEKLVFSLIWNDDEKIVKFGKAFCSKAGMYTWIVR